MDANAVACDPNDARVQPGAYVALRSKLAKGNRLCQVIDADKTSVVLQDLATDALEAVPLWIVCGPWELVRPAPTAPDTVPAFA